MVASRLSSAITGPLVVEPGTGRRLGGVLVTRIKVPTLKSVTGSSPPKERFAGATAGIWKSHISVLASVVKGLLPSVAVNVLASKFPGFVLFGTAGVEVVAFEPKAIHRPSLLITGRRLEISTLMLSKVGDSVVFVNKLLVSVI